jgi:maltodextrin utilization protein YvdJ
MKEWQQIIIGLFVILLFGYYLGITIASVVDYRLKDAIINLPEQKNTIYVNLDNKEKHIIEEKFTQNKSVKVVQKNNQKQLKTSACRKNKRFEHFEPTIKQNTDDTIVDQNQKAYALSYKLAKTLQTDTLPYHASNSYDLAQAYSSFEK